MAGLSLRVLRVGHRYRLTNYREVAEFEVEKSLQGEDYWVKDLHTLERYRLRDLLRLGRGPDYEIRELERPG